jgi:hypothetical protein
MSSSLTDENLASLQRLGGERACKDSRILKLLAEVVRTHQRAKIHWLPEDPEEVLGGWCAARFASGRLASLIDKAGSVRGLRAMLANDLQQYANEVRRRELPTKLFKRMQTLLSSNPERFQPVLSTTKPGSTCWTLSARPSVAIFSGDDAELTAHVFAVALVTLPENPVAKKQSQFLSPAELDRYVTEMLDRTARGLSLDQLTLGLVLAYGLEPSFTELPDESVLGDDLREGEPEGIQHTEGPALPERDSDAADEFLGALTPRQVDVLKHLHAKARQTETAKRLGCSPATISSELNAIGAALMKWPEREERLQVLRQTIDLMDGSGQ